MRSLLAAAFLSLVGCGLTGSDLPPARSGGGCDDATGAALHGLPQRVRISDDGRFAFVTSVWSWTDRSTGCATRRTRGSLDVVELQGFTLAANYAISGLAAGEAVQVGDELIVISAGPREYGAVYREEAFRVVPTAPPWLTHAAVELGTDAGEPDEGAPLALAAAGGRAVLALHARAGLLVHAPDLGDGTAPLPDGGLPLALLGTEQALFVATAGAVHELDPVTLEARRSLPTPEGCWPSALVAIGAARFAHCGGAALRLGETALQPLPASPWQLAVAGSERATRGLVTLQESDGAPKLTHVITEEGAILGEPIDGGLDAPPAFLSDAAIVALDFRVLHVSLADGASREVAQLSFAGDAATGAPPDGSFALLARGEVEPVIRLDRLGPDGRLVEGAQLLLAPPAGVGP